MDPNDLRQFLSLFLQNAEDHIHAMRVSLQLLSVDGKNKGEIEKIHRHAHSLKGECNALKFQKTAEVAHLLELYFFQMKTGIKQLSVSDVYEIKKMLAGLEASLVLIKQTGNEADLGAEKREFQARTGIM